MRPRAGRVGLSAALVALAVITAPPGNAATGPMQLAFTRFTADRLFEKREHLILSNYHAVALHWRYERVNDPLLLLPSAVLPSDTCG